MARPDIHTLTCSKFTWISYTAISDNLSEQNFERPHIGLDGVKILPGYGIRPKVTISVSKILSDHMSDLPVYRFYLDMVYGRKWQSPQTEFGHMSNLTV